MRSLTSRLTFWYALVVTVTVAVLILLGRFYLEHNMLKSIDLLNEVEFEEIRSRIDQSDKDREAGILEGVREHAELDAALYFFQVGRGHSDIIYKSSNLGPYFLPKAVHGHAHVTVHDEELGLLRSSEFNYAGLDIHIASSLHSAERLFDDYEKTGIIVCFGVFLLSLFIGYFLSRIAIYPIAAIQSKAREITASNFSERIPVPNTKDEIARMTALLNEMLDRLEASYEQVKRFTMEASHELRTPLSIIRLHAERLAQTTEVSAAECRAAAMEQLEEVGRLNKLIDDMLFLAKAEAGVMQLKCKAVDMEAFAEDFYCDASLLAEEKQVRFELKNEMERAVNFDPIWMRHVLLNLFTNALKQSHEGYRLILTFVEESGCPVFRMIDEGPGLPESKLETVFNRFERIETNGNIKGNGLGLAICRSIVQQHGGTIHALNRTDRSGLIVEVRLPDKAKCC